MQVRRKHDTAFGAEQHIESCIHGFANCHDVFGSMLCRCRADCHARWTTSSVNGNCGVLSAFNDYGAVVYRIVLFACDLSKGTDSESMDTTVSHAPLSIMNRFLIVQLWLVVYLGSGCGTAAPVLCSDQSSMDSRKLGGFSGITSFIMQIASLEMLLLLLRGSSSVALRACYSMLTLFPRLVVAEVRGPDGEAFS